MVNFRLSFIPFACLFFGAEGNMSQSRPYQDCRRRRNVVGHTVTSLTKINTIFQKCPISTEQHSRETKWMRWYFFLSISPILLEIVAKSEPLEFNDSLCDKKCPGTGHCAQSNGKAIGHGSFFPRLVVPICTHTKKNIYSPIFFAKNIMCVVVHILTSTHASS